MRLLLSLCLEGEEGLYEGYEQLYVLIDNAAVDLEYGDDDDGAFRKDLEGLHAFEEGATGLLGRISAEIRSGNDRGRRSRRLLVLQEGGLRAAGRRRSPLGIPGR